ncbi:MAG: hypothetical protein ACRC46_00215 [Thermoguttaceae bacterium]
MSTFPSVVYSNAVYSSCQTAANGNASPKKCDDKSTDTFSRLGDTITISDEAFVEYEKTENARLFQSKTHIDIDSWQAPKLGELRSLETLLASSKHHSPYSWALGIDHNDPMGVSLFAKYNVELVREKIRATAEGIDSKISGILQSNHVVLGKGETLRFKVNQDGKISVGEGVSGDKREKIENLLNGDKSLGKDLLFAHAQRAFADQGMTSFDANARKLLIDDLLQREYGVSLSDFEMRELASDDTAGQSAIVCKSDKALAEKLLNEEAMLHDVVSDLVARSGQSKLPERYEYGFAFKNGVIIENGRSDEETLEKYSTSFLTRTHLKTAAQNGRLDYSVTIDTAGNIVNAVVNSYNGKSDSDTRQSQTDFLRQFIRVANDESIWNAFSNQSTLRQFAYDSLRLAKFKTGDGNEATVTFGTKTVM